MIAEDKPLGYISIDPDSAYGKPYDPLRKEKNLWACCLIAGIMDTVSAKAVSTGCTAEARKQYIRQIKHEALEWVLSDSTAVGSFVYCCERCGLNHKTLRSAVLFLLQNNPIELEKRLSHLHSIDVRCSSGAAEERDLATRKRAATRSLAYAAKK